MLERQKGFQKSQQGTIRLQVICRGKNRERNAEPANSETVESSHSSQLLNKQNRTRYETISQ